MTTSSYPLIGVFSDRAAAERAIDGLYQLGVSNDQISYSGQSTGGGFAAGLKSLFTGEDESDTAVVQDLMNLGVPQDQAQYYAQQHRAGHPVVAVNAAGREQDVANVFQQAGGYTYSTQTAGNATTTDYSQTNQYADTGAANYAQTNQYADTGAANYAQTGQYVDDGTDTDRSLRLREEQLQAQKQTVQAGEVRLHKDIEEEQKTLNVPVSHEEVYIEQRPITDPQISDTPIGQDETIRVPVSAEQVNVNKTTVETGEVSLGKRTVTENQQVSDTVRRERARIERDGDVPIQDRTNLDNDLNR